MWSTLCVPRPHMQIDFWHILGRWQRQSIVKGQWTETQTEVFHATVSQPLPFCHFDFSICNLRFINFTLCSLPSSSRIIYACIIIIELLRSCSSSFAYFSPIIFSHMRNISQLILIQYRAPICPIRHAICIFYDLFCQPAAAAAAAPSLKWVFCIDLIIELKLLSFDWHRQRGEQKKNGQQQARLGGFFLWGSFEHFFMARQFLIDDAWKFRMLANYCGLGKCYSMGHSCLCPLLICIFD